MKDENTTRFEKNPPSDPSEEKIIAKRIIAEFAMHEEMPYLSELVEAKNNASNDLLFHDMARQRLLEYAHGQEPPEFSEDWAVYKIGGVYLNPAAIFCRDFLDSILDITNALGMELAAIQVLGEDENHHI